MKRFLKHAAIWLAGVVGMAVAVWVIWGKRQEYLKKAVTQANAESIDRGIRFTDAAYENRIMEVKHELETADADAIIAEFARRFGG